jgi:peptidoglycan/xylan/chitin deacetylase (PgdA/CDA1 family)
MLSDRTLVYPAGLYGRVPFALMYHSVTAYTCDPYAVTVTPERFAHQMAWLRRCGLRGVSMRDLLAATEAGRGGRLVGLTFDDGYADFLTDALPVLRRCGFGATVFALAGKLGGRNDWDLDGPVKFLLGPDQLREIAAAGIEIGSHGLGHRRLGDVSETVLWLELAQSRDILETVLGRAVHGFCYPYGELSDATMAAVAGHGYGYAVATRPTARRDRYALPRIYVGEADTGPRLLAKLIRHRIAWRDRRGERGPGPGPSGRRARRQP